MSTTTFSTRQSSPSAASACRALADARLLGGGRAERERCLPGRVPRRRVDRRLRDRRPPGRDDEREQHEQHGREHDEFERGAACVAARAAGAGEPHHDRNSSTGACTVSLTRTVSPGTKLGTRPDTVTATVVALLRRTIADGLIR